MNLSDEVDKVEAEAKGAAKWKLIGLAVLALCVASYLTWSFVHTPSPKAGAIMKTVPAVTAAKVEGPRLTVPLKIVPAKAVEKAFPQIGSIAPKKPVIDTAKIPPAKNGGSTVTFMNVSTGTAETEFIPDAAPWFALEDQNELSAGIEIGSRGRRVPVEYRRDIFQVKDVHLVADLGVKIPVEPRSQFEWTVGIKAAYRW